MGQSVQSTVLTGDSGLVAPQAAPLPFEVVLRPQFDFICSDISIAGSVQPAVLLADSLFFADRVVYRAAAGVPFNVFTGFVRSFFAGSSIAAGLTISFRGTVQPSPNPSRAIVTLVGLKRGTTGCGPGAV